VKDHNDLQKYNYTAQKLCKCTNSQDCSILKLWSSVWIRLPHREHSNIYLHCWSYFIDSTSAKWLRCVSCHFTKNLSWSCCKIWSQQMLSSQFAEFETCSLHNQKINKLNQNVFSESVDYSDSILSKNDD